MTEQRRVIVVEGAGPTGYRTTADHPMETGETVDIGREGRLPAGVSNSSISRQAVTVTATESGWALRITNRNGAVVHPWGQAPELAAPVLSLDWPLVGLRLLPDSASCRHWVLFEAGDIPVTPAGAVAATGTTHTDRARRPGDLPDGERIALLTVFGELLAWPPRHPAEPLLLKQAATRLQISISAVQARLDSARSRARLLGLPREVALTDPTYLFLLVRAGYLRPPPARAAGSAT